VVEYIGLVVPINVGGEVEYPVNLESGNQDTTQFYDVDLLNELGKPSKKSYPGRNRVYGQQYAEDNGRGNGWYFSG